MISFWTSGLFPFCRQKFCQFCWASLRWFISDEAKLGTHCAKLSEVSDAAVSAHVIVKTATIAKNRNVLIVLECMVRSVTNYLTPHYNTSRIDKSSGCPVEAIELQSATLKSLGRVCTNCNDWRKVRFSISTFPRCTGRRW